MLKLMLLVSLLSVPNTGERKDGPNLAKSYRQDYRPKSAAFVYDIAAPPNECSANIEPTKWYATPEGWLFILGVPTLFFVAWQARETARAAKSTEDYVQIARETAQYQLRAYVSVSIGPAIYQERRAQDVGGDLMFEARPLLINTGQTPAKNLRFKARAAILPVPLPQGHHLPDGFDENVGESILTPQQQANMFATVDGFCQDGEVDSIKKMSGDKALFTWGLVTYKDFWGFPLY